MNRGAFGVGAAFAKKYLKKLEHNLALINNGGVEEANNNVLLDDKSDEEENDNVDLRSKLK